MPLYDVKCDACGCQRVDVLASYADVMICPDCGCVMRRIPGIFNPHIFPSNGIFLKHVSSEGKRFGSKKEMKEYAKKYDLELGAL